MTKEIKTSILIKATPETIWNILTDFEKYSEWNPFIKYIEGKVKVNQKIQVKIQDMNFSPTLLTYTPMSEIKWLGHLWFKGIFDGEHQFLITQNNDGTSTFHQNEIFNGILVRAFSKKLDSDTKKGFEAMNEALKLRAEN